ncbi:MAG: hypothetical protein K8J08_21945 [Thermoanaerobaculia bacterium]|nr:hypothetical protein [Thermoanaerobaculia bacterium]
MASKSKSFLGFLAFLSILIGTQAVADSGARKADPNSTLPTVTARPVASPGDAPQVVGTLQYDNDTPFQRRAQTDASVGNRFVPAGTHSISAVSFRLAQNYGSSMFMTLWDVNPASAVVLARTLVGGLPNSTVTATVFSAALGTPIAAHSGSFIGGLHNTAYTGLGCPSNTNLNGTCDGVALTAGTVDPGMGFHGAAIQLAAGGFTPTTTVVATGAIADFTQNAIFRVTGDNLPVELMNFGVE